MRCIALLIVVCVPAAALAQTGPELLLKPWPQQKTLEASADALFYGGTHERENDRALSLNTYESTGRLRLFPGNIASPRLGYDYYRLDIQSSDKRLPQHLSDQSVAAGAFFAKYEGWVAGITAGVGYAGDTPFEDGSGWYAKSDLIFGKEISKNSAVVFVLDYDGNRTIFPDVPLPGAEFTFKAERDLQVVAGFPVNALTWTPMDRLKLELTYAFSDRLDARAGYEVVKTLELFTRFETRHSAFRMDELEGRNDRLFFTQRRAEVGLLWSPKPLVSILVAGGYAFNQEFLRGFDTRDRDPIAHIGDEPYVRVGVEIQW